MAFPAPTLKLRGPTTYVLALSTAYWGTWLEIHSPGMVSVNTSDVSIGCTVKLRIGEDGSDAIITVQAGEQWWHEFPRGTVIYLNVLSASGTPNAEIVCGG